MKKIISLILSFSLLAVTFFAVGCKKGEQSSGEFVESLELDKTSLVLTLGDTFKLNASYNEIENETLKWSSTAEKVVLVDSDGNLDAVGVGKATVKAKYGSKEVDCSVEVGLFANVPTLTLDAINGDELTVTKNIEFNLGAKVAFNGKYFDDGELSYFVGDSTICSISDGKLKTLEKEGETTVSVTGTWRGQTLHSITVKVKVIADTTVLLNGGTLTAIELYTAENHGGKAYVTEQEIFSVNVLEDGISISEYDFEIQRQDVASIEKDGDVWVVRSLKAGSTKLIVKYGNGKEYPFDIVVKRPVVEIEGVYDYSISDGMYYYDGQFKKVEEIASEFELKSYEYDGVEYQTVDGSFSNSVPVGENRTVVLYNDSVGYEINFNIYTLMIDELSDFEQIYAGDGSVVTGWFVLAKDIIEPNTVLTMPSGKVPNDFSGTFDGRGHVLTFTINHGSTQRFGLFGKFLYGATIKNVAFNDVVASGTAGNSAGLLCAECITTSTIKDIYLNLSFDELNNYACNIALMYNANNSLIMENVIIDVPTIPDAETCGSFARGNASYVSNSYVISSGKLHKSPDDPNSNKWTKIVPKLCENYQALKGLGVKFNTFSNEFWDVDTFGVPVWKSLVEDFSM
ncbi:MAG: Ig-like domain-containing protein [Clostridia bacterium]|nr:Ig-like domain-containing protein [Clostridia bacterium]